MRIIFIHQNFPAQFRHLAPALVALGHQVVALAANRPGEEIRGIRVIGYGERVAAHAHSLAGKPADDWQAKVIRGQAAADAMQALRDEGFVPDVVFAHPGWGESLFVRGVFPGTRFLVYAEYFYGATGGDVGFDPEFAANTPEDRQRVILKNTHLLHALSACDAALSPTGFQRLQHPDWAQEKIRVIHDGIDTERFKPDATAWVQLKSAGLTLHHGGELITFVARQLEPYRGFHVFMRALPLLQKLRPNARVIMVGGNGVSYGRAAPAGESWRSVLMREVGSRLDMSRVHLVGKVPHGVLTRLLQVSAVHVYLTYPFVLSWSLLEAMSIGCLIVASDTAPVREVIKDGETGLLTDFFDSERLARRIAFALENRAELAHLRKAARASIQGRYDLRSICLPRQIDFVLGSRSARKPVAAP